MMRAYQDADPSWLQMLHKRIRNLVGHTFLNLESSGKYFRKPRELAKTHNPATGNVSDVSMPGDIGQMMLTLADNWNIVDDDKFVDTVSAILERLKYVSRVLRIPTRPFLPRFENAFWRLLEALAIRIFPDVLKQLSYDVLGHQSISFHTGRSGSGI